MPGHPRILLVEYGNLCKGPMASRAGCFGKKWMGAMCLILRQKPEQMVLCADELQELVAGFDSRSHQRIKV